MENFIKREKTEWEDLRENMRIYELELPLFEELDKYKGTEKTIALQSTTWNSQIRVRYFQIMQISKIFINPKGTIKVAIAGDKYSLLVIPNIRLNGFSFLYLPNRSSPEIKEGLWVITEEKDLWGHKEYRKQRTLSFFSDEEKIEKIEALMQKLHELYEVNDKYKYKEGVKNDLETDGVIRLSDVLNFEKIFLDSITEVRFKEILEKWKKEILIRDRVSISIKDKNWKVLIKTEQPKFTYLFQTTEKIANETPSIPTEISNYLGFVYEDASGNYGRLPTRERILQQLLEFAKGMKEGTAIIGVDKKKVRFSKRETSSHAKLNYLNNTLVKEEDLESKLQNYLFLNLPLFPKPVTTTVKKTLSKEALKLIDEGLVGEMKDLEGRFPFHLNLIYKEQKRKWYIECDGKEYYVRGGVTALKKIKSAIEGKALIHNWDKYSWEEGGRSGTRLIKDRIAELVGQKNALKIVLTVKKMGALSKLMGETGKG